MIRRSPRPDANYTIIRNSVARDDRLSFRARGILTAILSRPDNWKTTSETLAREGTEGRDAIRTALRELEATGYIERNRLRLPNGTYVWEAVVFDAPRKPAPGNPSVENQATENQASQEELLRITEKKKDVDTPVAEDVAEVFATWLDATGKDKQRTKLDRKRKARIEWALKHYPKQDVMDAVVGWRNSPFHSGRNPKQQTWNELTLLLRDASQLEKFRDLARNQPVTGAPDAWTTLQRMMEEE